MNRSRRRAVAIGIAVVAFVVHYFLTKAIMAGAGLEIPSLKWLIATGSGYIIPLVAGLVLGIVISAVRRELRRHLRAIASLRWIGTTLLVFLFAAVLTWAYSVLKIAVHAARPVSYDRLLWEIDRWLLLGISPNVFFLELFAHPLAYQAIDSLYVAAFGSTMLASFVLIFGWRRNDERIGFIIGSVVLWLGGAWLYYAVPSLGPAYAFHDVWESARDSLPTATALQARLLTNHLMLLRKVAGEELRINVYMAIGAFPSLHVGFHVHFALWLQRLIPRLRIVGWVVVVAVVIGSVVTGWHYLVDSLAGALLAWIAWRAGVSVTDPRPPAVAAAPHAEENEPPGGEIASPGPEER